jgi:hypothetical protein
MTEDDDIVDEERMFNYLGITRPDWDDESLPAGEQSSIYDPAHYSHEPIKGSFILHGPVTGRIPPLCPTKTPEPHEAGEFPMTCYQCHLVADS